jgi:hypothetical protein
MTTSPSIHIHTQARTEAGLHNLEPNAASFVKKMMDVRESKLKTLAKFLFTAFSIIRENSDAFKPQFFRVKCTTFINVYHNNRKVCTCCHPCMYVCIVPNVSVLWAGGIEKSINMNMHTPSTDTRRRNESTNAI